MSGYSVIVFYLGTFLTSFGSLLFVMCVAALLTKAGYAATIIGITIGVHRFSGIGAGMWFGPDIDRYDARKVVFGTELLAAITTVALVISWQHRNPWGLYAFWLFVGLRAICIGVQSTSRSRLIKLLSMGNQGHETSLVIWLNKVTQGAHVLSALAALVLIQGGRLESAIIIDGISFIIGGVTTWLLPDLEKSAAKPRIALNVFTAIKKMIGLHSWWILFDVLLSVVVSGTILLMVKLSQGDPTYIIYYNLIFGSCIWLSSVFAHNFRLRKFHAIYWLMLAGGFALLTLNRNLIMNLAAYMLAYMGYWILYHKYSVTIQTQTPEDSVGGVMAARGLVAALTLSCGELFGGYLQGWIGLQTELYLRAGLCVVVLALMVFTSRIRRVECPS